MQETIKNAVQSTGYPFVLGACQLILGGFLLFVGFLFFPGAKAFHVVVGITVMAGIIDILLVRSVHIVTPDEAKKAKTVVELLEVLLSGGRYVVLKYTFQWFISLTIVIGGSRIQLGSDLAYWYLLSLVGISGTIVTLTVPYLEINNETEKKNQPPFSVATQQRRGGNEGEPVKRTIAADHNHGEVDALIEVINRSDIDLEIKDLREDSNGVEQK